MLTKDEELRLAAIIATLTAEADGQSDLSLTLETVQWLADKLKETNNELKNHKCDGSESHRHFNLGTSEYVWHSHLHNRRPGVDYNSFHHHHPREHEKV